MNIFDLDKALVDRYASFARSFSSIRAPEIDKQIRDVYEQGKFWPAPLITINPRFLPGKSIEELAASGDVTPELASVFAVGAERTPIRLHRHQERAVAKARNRESFVVTTGTGSGKSLCFFVPIVDAIIRAKKAGEAPRTRAIIIYPMNALANSQLGEIRKFIAEADIPEHLRPTVARYTGQETPAERQQISQDKPDILLTNFMMLELLMTRQEKLDRAVIENAQGLDFLVLDELHTYRGRQGADVAMLVRRVKQRLTPSKDLICIGTSATMSSSPDELERAAAVAEVATKLFGQPISSGGIIDETLDRATSHEIKAETLGEPLRQAVLQPLAPKLSDTELRVHPLACWIETQIGLEDGEKLRRRRPMTLPDAAAKLAEQTGLAQADCTRAIAEMLAMMGKREDQRGGTSSRAFLAFKLHRFISGAGQAYATLESAGKRRVSLEGQKYHPEDEKARLYPLFFCRECGQEHHSVSVTFADGAQRVIARPIDEPARDEAEPDGTETGYLVPAVNEDFRFSGEVSDYPDEWLEVAANGQERLKPSHRGKHEGRLVMVRPDGSFGDDGVPAWFFSGKYRFCPECGHQPASGAREINKLAGLSAEGRSSATTLIVSTILAWMERDGTLKRHTRKLLGFTDNRQDAALQAGHFNDFIFVTLLRGAILRAVRAAGPQGLKPDKFGEAVRQALGFDLEEKGRLGEWMLDPNAKGYQNRQEAQEILSDILAHRLWADLRRGWRYTNPNLEEVGLVAASFPGLDDLVQDDEEFLGNERLAKAAPEQRRKLYEILFDNMRQGLAVATDALDRGKVRQAAEVSRNRLRLPWAIDREEENTLRECGFLMINPPRNNTIRATEAVLILRAGRQSKLGKALRQAALWDNQQVPSKEYDELIETLLKAAEAHQFVRRVDVGYDAPAWRMDNGQLSTTTLILCPECGAAHTDELQERCHACAAPLGGAERLDTVFRIDNVETAPSERITANDEDRQRRGFEIQTVFQWPIHNGSPDIRSTTLCANETELLRLDYGAATKLSRINKGLRRRKSKSICGFFIDPNSGRWLKDPENGDDDDGMGDPTQAKQQRIVPMVEDHKNALLLQPKVSLSTEEMATFQHAFIRGIQLVFELEEGEILGEPLPTRDIRHTILLYEATEGGAGVLNRLVADPAKVAEVARESLKLMHYKEPFEPSDMIETEDACVAGCYRCILSYFNQPDHELIDRRKDNVISLLCELTFANESKAETASAGDPWGDAVRQWGLPTPAGLSIAGRQLPLFWPAKGVLAVPGGASPELVNEAAALGILDIIDLPDRPAEHAPAELLTALGVSR